MSRHGRLVTAIVLNLVIVAFQAVYGLMAHSLGLLSDAGHNLTDVAALALSLFAVRLIVRSPTETHSYGYHRSGVLVAQANAAAILAATCFIVYEAIRRLGHPDHVDGLTVIIVAAIALVANGLSTLLLTGHADDLNMRSAMLHLAGDAAASAGVVVTGIVMYATDGNYWLDPAISLAIAAILAYRAVRLLGETTRVLMEATPAGLDLGTVTIALRGIPEVDEVHDVHAWSLSTDMLALSAHLVVQGHPSLEDAQAVAVRAKRLLHDQFAIGHATLEIECESCLDEHHSPRHVSHHANRARPEAEHGH